MAAQVCARILWNMIEAKRAMLTMKLIPAVLTAALLSGCMSTGTTETKATGQPQVFGSISSQREGGNAKLKESGTGTLVGAFLSKDLEGLDKTDVEKRNQAALSAYRASVGDKIQWTNPATGRAGSVTTTREGWSSTGQYCREFQDVVSLKDRTDLSFGTACKQADGAWKLVPPGSI